MDEMDTTGSAWILARMVGQTGLRLLLVAVALALLTSVAVVALADTVAPAAEPIMTAGWRWSRPV
jgi:lipopolysaccharide export LptBFGC system permease protein LptF